MTIKTTTKALLGTAVSFALLGSVANAADLDNLSDNDLLERIERLEAIIGPGDKYAVRSGNNKVRISLSGQVNVLALGFADGENAGLSVADNTNSGTRFRILGEAKINESWSAATELEFQANDRGSFVISQNNRNPLGSTAGAFGTRLANLSFKHKDFGRVRIGQQHTASEGTSEVDLSGTGVASYSSVTDIGAGLEFVNSTTDALSGFTVGNVFTNLDGAGRDDAIRYDTPTIAGFTLATSYISDDSNPGFDVSLKYRNKDFAGFGISAAVAYLDQDTSTGGDNRVNGSVSVIHLASGINATFAAGDDNDDGQFLYGKLGIITELNSLGKTAFSGDVNYSTNVGNGTNNFQAASLNTTTGVITAPTAATIELSDTEALNFGFQAVQNIDAAAAQVYVGYKYFDLDADNSLGANVDFENVHVFYAGSRIKF